MCNINDVRLIDRRELLDISQQRFRTENALDVWKHIPGIGIPGTYVRESTFSTMEQVKYENKNRMADETPDHRLRLATFNILTSCISLFTSRKWMSREHAVVLFTCTRLSATNARLCGSQP